MSSLIRVRKEEDATKTLPLLIGKTIRAAFITPDRYSLLLVSDEEVFEITHHNDCCEDVYYAHINQIQDLFGTPILKVEELEYQDLSIPNDGPKNPKTETFYKLGIAVHTAKGTITFETRMEGNGCYAGDLTVTKLVDDCNHKTMAVPAGFERQARQNSTSKWEVIKYVPCCIDF